MGPRRSKDSHVGSPVREQEGSEGEVGERSRQHPPQPWAILQFWDRQSKAGLQGLREEGKPLWTQASWRGLHNVPDLVWV